MCDITYFRVAV